jgi:FlaA1/EpsC-like NDP-sugar epimerase
MLLSMDNLLEAIGRKNELFVDDIAANERELSCLVQKARFLVIGGAGSIGQAVVREILKRLPRLLHVVDISENNLVELVRNLRGSGDYKVGEFATFAIDCGSDIFNAFMENGSGYDYLLNLSALKHVRSEKDPYTLMRMVDVNIFNTENSMLQAKAKGVKKYFCVSSDKATNPVNMMGASKRIMEMFLLRRSLELPVSTARFANVAFSDGSLLYGFSRRIENEQPLAAPNDVRRYFVTPKESGELCLLSCLLGENRDLFFPKVELLKTMKFSEIAIRFLHSRGYEAVECSSEEEARSRIAELKPLHRWPVFLSASDTTGEKDLEEFYTNSEIVNNARFRSVGIIKNEPYLDTNKLEFFELSIKKMRDSAKWSREDLIALFKQMIPEFHHLEKGKFLDQMM